MAVTTRTGKLELNWPSRLVDLRTPFPAPSSNRRTPQNLAQAVGIIAFTLNEDKFGLTIGCNEPEQLLRKIDEDYSRKSSANMSLLQQQIESCKF